MVACLLKLRPATVQLHRHTHPMSDVDSKDIGLFLPWTDTMRLWRGHKTVCVPNDKIDHCHKVAIDTQRLMASVTPGMVVAPNSNSHDSARKLITLHLGKTYKAVWRSLYNDRVLDEMEAQANERALVEMEAHASDLFKNWTNLEPDTDAERNNMAQIKAEYWVQLFHCMHLDFTLTLGSKSVMFPKRGELKPDMSLTKDMPTFVSTVDLAKRFGVREEDYLLVYFVASALRHKNGFAVLNMFHSGHGIDKANAPLQNLDPSAVNALWNEISTSTRYDWNSEGSLLVNKTESDALGNFEDDWVTVLNFVQFKMPKHVGIVRGVTSGEVRLDSTQAGYEAAKERERADLAKDGISDDGAMLDATAGGSADEWETTEARRLLVDQLAASDNIDARIAAARAAPLVRAAAAAWQSGASANTPAVLVARQLFPRDRDARARVIAAALQTKAPLGLAVGHGDALHAKLERPLHSDGVPTAAAAADFYATARAIGRAIGAEPAAVRDFSAAVYNATGVPYAERPIDAADRIADYLTVYAHGLAPKRCGGSWTSLWRGGAGTLSHALHSAITAYTAAKPAPTVDEAADLVRALAAPKAK